MNIRILLVYTMMFAQISCNTPHTTFQLRQPIKSVMFSPTDAHIIALNIIWEEEPDRQMISVCTLKSKEIKSFHSDIMSINAHNFSPNNAHFYFPTMAITPVWAQDCPLLINMTMDNSLKLTQTYTPSSASASQWKYHAFINEQVELFAAHRKIFIRDLNTDAEWQRLGFTVWGNIKYIVISQDGKKIAALTHQHKRAKVFVLNDDNTVQCYLTLHHNNNGKTLLFNQESSVIISAQENIIRIFDITAQQKQGISWDEHKSSGTLKHRKPIYSCQNPDASLRGHEDYITTLALSPNTQLLASGAQDATVRIWFINNSAEKNESILLHDILMLPVDNNTHVNHVTFSPDGKLVAGATSAGEIYVWDLEAEDPAEAPLILQNFKQAATCVAFSADSRSIVAGSAGGKICVWDI